MKKSCLHIALSCLISTSALGTTMSEALISAYHNNPELNAARENLKTIDEKMAQAISGFLPSIHYTARKQYNKTDTIGQSQWVPTEAGVESQTSYRKADPWVSSKAKESKFTITQNIFNGGRSVMAVRMAKYSIEAARAQLTSTEQQILLQTAQAFLVVLHSKNVLDINKENVAFYEAKSESVKQEVELGVKKNSDAAEAEAAKANAYTKLAQAQGDYDSALASYNKLAQIPADHLVLEKNLVKDPANQMELLQNSLRNNPDIINITLQQKNADINLVSNAAVMLPKVDLSGSVSKTWSQQTNYNPISSPYRTDKVVGIFVDVPIYQQGLEYSGIRGASADAAKVKYMVKNVKAEVTQKATESWSRYNSALATVKSTEEAVKSAKVALEGVQHGYEEGVNTITDLLNTKENLYQYQISASTAKVNLELSRYSMASLIGKLTAKEMALPTKIYNMSENYDKIKFKIVGF